MSSASEDSARLVDDPARAAIAGELDATLFVEAGAGTGKTTALVSRVVAIVRNGVAELREIAAITFTEAAAFELRERIREAIVTAAAKDPGDGRLARAVHQVDEAAIGTIHGFCHRVLAEHPLEAALPLRFEVLDEIAAAIAFDQRFLSFLDELYDEADSRVLLGAAGCLQITPWQLRMLARQLDERWDELPDATGLPEEGDLAHRIEAATLVATDAIASALERLVGYAGCCTDERDGLSQRIEELIPALASVRELADWMDGLRFLSELRVRKVGNVGRRESWMDVEVQQVRDAFVELEAVRAEHLARLCDLVLSHLLVRLGAEARRAAAERRRSGALYFHDLLAITHQLLGSDAAIRHQVRSRFSKILVDEFQDTDPLQLQIVLLLGAATPGERPEEGRLFFVGDPKQSIYRFRGADVAAYGAAFSSLGVAAPTRLVANFRSVPAILEWVNGVFSELLGEQGGYSALEAVRPALSEQHPVTVIGGPTAEGVSTGERRLGEAADVAEMVTRAVAEGWPVRDGDLVRPARFGDIAILVPRRTGLFSLERALEEREIPYQVSSSTLVYGSAEVRDLRAVLSAIAPGADERAVLAALRTPAFGCSDDELLEYRLAGGTFALRAAPPEAVLEPAGRAWESVTEALSALSVLHDDAYHLGVVGVLEALLRSRKVVAFAAGAARRREALRRIDFVLERARAFSRSGGSDLAAFLSFLDLEAKLNVRSIELPASDDAGDVVRILTVHGAKGLEFPIVVLTELGGPPVNVARGPRVIRGDEGRLEARIRSGLETAGFGACAADEEEADIAEALRIAYVGATRARDHLVVCLHHQEGRRPGARSIAERIAGVLGAEAGESHEVTTRPVAPAPVAVTIGATPANSPLDLEQWRRARAELLARLQRPTSVAATALVPPPIYEPRRRHVDEEEATGEWQRPRAATRVGRAVHRLLQEVDLGDATPLGELARRAAEEEECADESEIVERLATAALASPVVRRAARSEKLWRELPLSVALDGGVLEAIIDLVFEDNGEITIVDYKTDALFSASEAATAAERYRSQVGAYALAVEALLGRPVAEVVLLFLALPSGAIEHRVAALDDAITDARRRAADVLAGVR